MGHLLDEKLSDGLYSDLERAVIEYSRRSTRMEPIDDRLYETLARDLPPPQMIELCFTVGVSNLINRFHATFLTDLDERTAHAVGPNCPLPVPPQPGGS